MTRAKHGLAAFGLAMCGAMAPASAEDVIVSHGFSNFGALKYGPGEPFSYVNLDAPKGGEISLSTLATFDSFNPFTRKGVAERTGDDLLYENLMIAAADDPYGSYCYLCTTIEYPESLDWVVMNLRDDVTFSDGTPMTAEDVKFTIDLFLDQGIAEFRSIIDGFFENIEVTGSHQIRFEFTQAAPKRDRMGLVGLWNPFSKEWFARTGARLDESTDEEAFKTGAYTFRTPGSSKEWATAYDFPAVQDGHVTVDTIPSGNITGGSGFVFNLRREKWQDNRVRDAVRMLFNFEWSNQALFFNLFERHHSFWQGSNLEAVGAPEGAELAALEPLVAEGLLDASILETEVLMPPINTSESNRVDRRSRRQALSMLEDAGWSLGDDGLLRNAAGETLELIIIQFNAEMDRIINPYIDNLRAVGIDASLRRVDTAQYVELRRSGDWDLTNIAAGQGFEPSLGLKQWFGSETAENSSRNIMALADPAVDRLIDAVIEAKTLDELEPRTRALDRVLRAHGFWVPRWGTTDYWVAYWDQYRHPDPLPPLDLGLLDFWWYDAEAAQQLKDAGAL
ncbi:extracellular solute-binding protein [Thalassobacter stenotrophicus]|uniref:Nickel ABC transporter, nickel/metallophore periplasmic binding protein n=2 Tax=Thalassobacter stenotrophicus TaxID=266809 RepID=A0A0P1EWN3_9RHOB|nr:extracellular solute-binding protein [Thalassobacter stenotrophicus]CUH58920.1 nickel ABC transporter, nickel/metallophore periplasmic binding protein [Thalassobacter stenotrophicus]SHJ26819.1 ABC-type oligopeptide transport system, substrate-binding protein [Thalassobacter stenotrophicus DSM 16310]